MSDVEFLEQTIEDLTTQLATAQLLYEKTSEENERLRAENAKIPRLEAQVKALQTGNSRLLEEKLRADGIAQKKANELYEDRSADLEKREKKATDFNEAVNTKVMELYDLRVGQPQKKLEQRQRAQEIREDSLNKREKNMREEVAQKVAAQIAPQKKKLDDLKNELDAQKKKLEDDRNTYRSELAAEYKKEIAQVKIWRVGFVAAVIIFAGFLTWREVKNKDAVKKIEREYDQVVGWNRQFAEITRAQKAQINKLEAQIISTQPKKRPQKK